jgi:hypothetical protein
VYIVAAPATAVDAPRTALDLDLLGMPLVSHQECPYGGFLLAFFYHVVVAHDESTRPPLTPLITLAVAGCTTGSPRPLVPMLMLRVAVLSLYPTTGSALPMGMGQRSRLCRSVHPTARRLRSPSGRSSKKALYLARCDLV